MNTSLNRNRSLVRAGAAALLLGLAMGHAAYAASAEPVEIDDDLRATIQKEKTKQRRTEKTAGGQESGGKSGCGQIDIGNEQEKKGSKQVASREKTVIVTGPVVNANNCR